MSESNSEKSKKPYSPDDISAIEDRLAKIQGDLRDIRQGLKDGPLAEVELKAGTFLHFLLKLEQLAKKYKGEFEAQRAVASAKATRERIKKEGLKRTQNRS